MENIRSNEQAARYNDEVVFLDGLVEFHPDLYNVLTDSEKSLLRQYYLTAVPGDELPNNIFSYRDNLLREYPELASQAKQVFDRLVAQVGIDNFTYTTDVIHRSQSE